MIFKIFFQNYSLSIDNAQGSLLNMLQVREQGKVNRQGSPIYWGGK